ncbi:MAG: hypothetical protein N3E40_04825, partial [Dehalococcoidia bacterium]|nr:hypothetical protein [Dehalococcoidia bacterium]
RGLGDVYKRQLLYTATRVSHPMAIRYPRNHTSLSCPPQKMEEIPVGRGELLREGRDVTILAVGTMSYAALLAARALAELGIEATVINVRYVKPLDSELIAKVSRSSGRVLTVEENVLAGGFGSAVAQLLHSTGLDGIRIRSIGINDQYVEHGPQDILRSRFGLDAPGIISKIIEFFPELNARIGDRPFAVAGQTVI